MEKILKPIHFNCEPNTTGSKRQWKPWLDILFKTTFEAY